MRVRRRGGVVVVLGEGREWNRPLLPQEAAALHEGVQICVLLRVGTEWVVQEAVGGGVGA